MLRWLRAHGSTEGDVRSLGATLRALGSLGLAGLCACSPVGARAPSAFEALKEDSAAVVRRIAWLRQLPELRATALVFHEPSEFKQIIDSAGRGRPTAADHPAFQQAFGFVGKRGQRPAALSSVRRDEIVAFFDERTFTVHVRADAEQDAESEVSPSWVVAHEVGHSLQHQHFQIPDVEHMAAEDERLAALAMLEGDAMLVMLAYASYEQRMPLSRSIVRVTRAIGAGRHAAYDDRGESSAAFERAPAVVQSRLVFPYLGGATFMGSLYRTGGYALVNQVYQHPPTTTEQVLHPQKYLEGEQAVPVLAPRLPGDYQFVAGGSMGELQIRAMFEGCHSPGAAERAAEGWGGDAFSIGRRGEAGVLVWSTTWDSELDAQEFEYAVRGSAECWARDLGAASGVTETLRSGAHVAMVRGLAGAPAQLVLSELVRLPKARVANRSHFGPVRLNPVPPPPLKQPALVVGSSVIAPYLGLSIPIPPGFSADLRDEIMLEGRSRAGTLMLIVSDWIVDTSTNERLFSEFLTSFTEGAGVDPSRLERVAAGARPTPLGPALERHWRVTGTPLHARLSIVPACQGSGALLLAESWSDETVRLELERAVQGLQVLGPGLPPLCGDLNP